MTNRERKYHWVKKIKQQMTLPDLLKFRKKMGDDLFYFGVATYKIENGKPVYVDPLSDEAQQAAANQLTGQAVNK